MSNYRAVVHYTFKKGMEEEGLKFLENELVKKGAQYGCHGIELLQNGKDSTTVIGIGYWNDIEEARKFQSAWDKKEKELAKYCTSAPKREFYKIRCNYMEKARKIA